ncbi:MAG: MBL fold metallo-hydrolase, partial [Rhodocyclaceae bacterium]|nr:MBL fold metallo-hydrolase [Rhodocyclaceae bacterium]
MDALHRLRRTATALPAVVLLAAGTWATAAAEPKEATAATGAANAALLGKLPFADRQDYEDAVRGFVGTVPDAEVPGPAGQAWSMREYAFLKQAQAPATINPSLWRQAQLNLEHGLYKVTDGIYQVRGFDLSNMTIVEGDTGLIVIDPLTSKETAQASLELYYRHRPRRPVVAVIYSHSHADHFGGVKGVTTDAEVESGKVRILAPAGFMEHAVSENIIAGNAMGRRAQYQFGSLLPRGERSQVDAGLGKNLPRGTITLIPPTDVIDKARDRRVIDGVEILFHLAPGTEAPAEMHMYFPRFKALNMAENATHNLHNLLPFRGAEVRDPKAWSQYLAEAVDAFGGEAEVLLAQHHWPTFGNARLRGFLAKQRDLYKYLHDQTLRLINHGHTATEIAEVLELPPSLAAEWSARGYYGTVSHNAKAIYQKYLGWYDANPANLNPLPPAESGRKYVEYMGGAAALMARARQDFERGEYRWVAQAMNHLVFAEPENRPARELAADALEQLGYQAEAATWRNSYLFAAWELRNGTARASAQSPVNPDTLKALDLDMFFDFLGVRLNGPKAEGRRIVLNWNFTDVNRRYVLNLENSALTWVRGRQSPNADATLTLTRKALDQVTLRRATFNALIEGGQIQVEGNPGRFFELLMLMDSFEPQFEIVEPKRRK